MIVEVATFYGLAMVGGLLLHGFPRLVPHLPSRRAREAASLQPFPLMTIPPEDAAPLLDAKLGLRLSSQEKAALTKLAKAETVQPKTLARRLIVRAARAVPGYADLPMPQDEDETARAPRSDRGRR